MTPAQAAARLNRIVNALQKRCVAAVNLSAKQGVILAKDRSKGPCSLATLRAMGHPYARRHLASARRSGMTMQQYARQAFGNISVQYAYIVNRQTGAFLENWHTGAPSSAFNGNLRQQVINNDLVAKYMKGTKFMIERPIGKQVAKLLRPIAYDNVRQAVRRATKTK